MNSYTLYIIALINTGLALFSCTSQKEKIQYPNIVFIMADDLGWTDVGFMGSKYYETPNIDHLAKKGMIFTDAYTCAPNCAPTRASIVSGQYSPRHGVYTVRNSERGVDSLRKLIPVKNNPVLDSSFVTIAEVLKNRGYKTGLIGKWHLGDEPGFGPNSQGFDINIGGGNWGHPGEFGSPRAYFSPYNNPAIEDGPEGEYLTDRLAQEATQFIEENQDRSFFMYFSTYVPHRPLQAKIEDIDLFKSKKTYPGQDNPVYAAMIYSLDRAVGQIIKKLKHLNLEKRTLIIFYSDNGGEGGYNDNQIVWRNGGVTSNAPLRGGKGMFYEGGIRVPLIFSWPGKIENGSQCNIPVTSIDFFPTFLDIVNTDKKVLKMMDGKSLLPLLTNNGAFSRDAIYWHFPCYLEAEEGTFRSRPVGVIRSGNFKLMEFFEDNRLELYNVKYDIGERNNLSDELPEKTRELYQKLKEWREDLGAPVPTILNPKYHMYSEKE